MLDDRPAPERIPAGCTPKDLIYGDPDRVDDLVIELRAYAGAFDDGRDQLQVLELKEWSGEGASAFEKATERLPKELDSAHKHFLDAAAALDAYADKLRSVQNRCRPIIEDADEARAASKRYWKDVEAYNDAVERGDDPLPERPSENDPGAAAMTACVGRLDKLIEELQVVVDASRSKLSKGAEDAPDKPKGWAAAKENVGDLWGGFKDGVDSLLGIVEPLIRDAARGNGRRCRLRRSEPHGVRQGGRQLGRVVSQPVACCGTADARPAARPRHGRRRRGRAGRERGQERAQAPG
ncbi:putative T7SS-secreted protein [Streptomyces sp. NPDC056831]|uniref:putative T7SS-secreted protein n=1 Tax=Streptomyces sp. NPDC056831 TaxID=3345954 RepID=UPI0036CE49E1